MLLFGSRAKSEYLKHSDYDFIIVSKKFEGVHFLDRMYRVLELWDYEWEVDISPCTPSKFEEKRKGICIVGEAVKEWMVIEV